MWQSSLSGVTKKSVQDFRDTPMSFNYFWMLPHMNGFSNRTKIQIFRFEMERKVLAHPCVVEAVTLTTIMVAFVRICWSVSLFLHFSRLFPNSWGIMNRAESRSYHDNWIAIWFKRKVNNTWSHLDCPDVVKRVWDQRFKLWKSFGVFVSCKFMNNIWKQTVAIRIFLMLVAEMFQKML